MDLAERVKEHARALGFDAVGIARAGPIERDYGRYEDFVARGFHGEMDWLARNAEARSRTDGDEILLGARSVICVASSYKRTPGAEGSDPPLARRIARYARGRDYHNGLRKKLRKLAAFVRKLGEGVRARPLCDDAPILERAWAARAGLGFIGKNGLLIVPGRGSFVLLGEVVTTLELDAVLLGAKDGASGASELRRALEPRPASPERCGSCTRCIDACPTNALVEPFVLDARRCISYLTIELRGPIPVALRPNVGDHLFGCDDCQTVCPFNHSARETRTSARYEPLDRWRTLTLDDLLAGKDVGEGTPLRRATADGIARNAAVTLGNQPNAESRPTLERAAASHPSAVVRDAARWALERSG